MNELLIATQKASGITEDLDPNYNLVSLHLRGDVNTGRDYNAFSDASSNNFRLTNNGDVRGSSFSPYGTSWSGFFDGSTDYLSITNPTTNIREWWTTDYTIEAWVFPLDNVNLQNSNNDPTMCGNCDVPGNDYWSFGPINSGVVRFKYYNGSPVRVDSSQTITVNQWNHVAMVKTSSGITIFVNGVSSSTTAISGTPQSSVSVPFTIGANYNKTINAHVSNLRIVKGTAVYTGNFTSPTSPLAATQSAGTNISAITGTQTVLLACHANRFIDRDGAAGTLAITRNGDTRISSFSPFLDSDTTSGSGYFDGNADYLSATSNAAFSFGTDAFTIEAWIFPTSTTSYRTIFTSRGTAANAVFFGLDIGTLFPVLFTSAAVVTSSVAVSLNAWSHVALVRNSGTSTIYVNGVSGGSASNTTDYTSTNCLIGIESTQYPWFGYISNLRIVKGTAVYTGAFTPPTAPLAVTQSSGTNIQAITGTATQLLTLQERGAYNTVGFEDESEYKHIITRNGNVAQGTFSPFSQAGWAVNFGGGSSNINLASSADFALGGAFSFECWVYQTSIPNFVDLLDVRTSNEVGSLGISATGFPRWQNGPTTGSLVTGSTALTLNQWNYLLFVADASGCSIYLNGQRIANTAQVATWPTSARPCFIGGSFGNASGGSLSGFIADARLIKGSTPYSSTATSVTVPTALLPFVTNTVLQCCRTNRFVNTVNSASMTANGTTSITAFSPLKPPAYDPQVHGGSGYFDGSADYLTGPTNSPAFDFGSGLFTIEFWIYPVALSTIATIVCSLDSATGSALAFGVQILTDGSVKTLQWGGSSYFLLVTSTAGVVKLNAWNHVAVVRNGANFGCFVNGNREGSSTTISGTQVSNATLNIGRDPYGAGSLYPYGYLSSLRVVKGSAVYDPTQTTITVPSGPLPILPNTSLLLNFTNGGVIDSTGKNVIETFGNAGVVTTAIKKYGSGSIYMAAAAANTDYLVTPASRNVQLGSGDFTIEFWMRPDSVTTSWANSSLATILDLDPSAGTGTDWWFIHQLNNTVQFGSNAATILTSSALLVATTWQHIALVRSGSGSNNLTFYINGTASGSATYTSTIGGNRRLFIGTQVGSTRWYKGYIDDLRITSGLARYVTGTDANVNKMVFNGTNTLALPTKALPNRAVASTATTSLTAPTSVEALIIGGGGGAGGQQGGGGGAGGFREFVGGNAIAVSANNSYRITVGSSGSGGASGAGATSGTSGGSSIFSTVTSEGGGGGGTVATNGLNGGSGGGGGHNSPGTSLGGLGNRVAGTTTVVPTQGNNGGDSNPNATNYYAGGGGGAGGVGQNGSPNNGNGGLAQTSSITGTALYYAGGGGAGSRGGTAGLGGGTATTASKGGGGDGSASGIGLSAITNTGGGGGGGAYAYNGGNGGSGVVILAYPITNKPLTASLGLVYTIDTVTRPGYRVYKFVAGTGTISW